MPTRKPTPELPSNDLILAAIERAICHRSRGESAEPLNIIKEYLGIAHNGWTTLQLRPKLEALEAATLIEQSRRNSKTVWRLTPKGLNRLDTIRSTLTLPEAPQHERWREARAAAAERIDGFRTDLHTTLNEAIDLLEGDEATSATWFEISEQLRQAGRLLASATYCLREWQEPDDSTTDIDKPPYHQQGRRQIHGWDSETAF